MNWEKTKLSFICGFRPWFPHCKSRWGKNHSGGLTPYRVLCKGLMPLTHITLAKHLHSGDWPLFYRWEIQGSTIHQVTQERQSWNSHAISNTGLPPLTLLEWFGDLCSCLTRKALLSRSSCSWSLNCWFWRSHCQFWGPRVFVFRSVVFRCCQQPARTWSSLASVKRTLIVFPQKMTQGVRSHFTAIPPWDTGHSVYV